MNLRTSLAWLIVCFLFVPALRAQGQTNPNKIYTGSFGGGFALTGGNTDTKNFNLAFDVVRDPKTRNVWKATAAYLRGTQTNVLNLDRTAFNIRYERVLTDRIFAFGQLDYLRDQFKQIQFLWAPSGGLGYKLINTDSTQLLIDGGAGSIKEKNPGRTSQTSGSLNAGQRFRQKLSGAALFTESVATIWKTDDYGDSLTNFSAGLTTALMKQVDVKLEFVDSYKNKPPNATVKKNDTAFVTGFMWKF